MFIIYNDCNVCPLMKINLHVLWTVHQHTEVFSSGRETDSARSFLISPPSCPSICFAPSVIHLNKCHRFLAFIYLYPCLKIHHGPFGFCLHVWTHWGRHYLELKRPSAALPQMNMTTHVRDTSTVVVALVYIWYPGLRSVSIKSDTYAFGWLWFLFPGTCLMSFLASGTAK